MTSGLLRTSMMWYKGTKGNLTREVLKAQININTKPLKDVTYSLWGTAKEEVILMGPIQDM